MNKLIYKIAFRLDGGHHFGMGHVVRCIAIAHELKKRIDVKILFVVNDSPECISIIEKDGFSTKKYVHNEIEEVYKILYQFKPDVIFNDLPYSSEEYMEKIKELSLSINYDDGGPGSKLSDNLIHVTYKTRNELVGKMNYLYGPEYLILRNEFLLYREKTFNKTINLSPISILIMMGGSDPANLTVKALIDLQNINTKLDINIVTGIGYHYQTDIEKCIKDSKHNVFQYNNVKIHELLKIMTQADIGVVHYGITAYEMACVGLPFVAIAHNSEEFNENRLTEYGFCVDAGLCDNLKKGDIAISLNKILTDISLRKELSIKGMDSVDAKGLSRVSNLIIEAIKKIQFNVI